MQKAIKVLFVTTNIKNIDDNNETGVNMEEFAVPYLTFINAGYEVVAASPLGGVSPIDDNSISCSNPTEWDVSKKVLDNTEKLDDVDYKLFDVIFLPGGHGPMFDLAKCEKLGEILGYFYYNNKIIGAICHGPAGFITAKKADGTPLIEGKKLTAFSNKEEHILKTDEIMPFSLEDKLKELGAVFTAAAPFAENVIVDGNILTGQNPKSAQELADTIWKMLG